MTNAVNRTISKETLDRLWEAGLIKFGVDENGDINAQHVDADGASLVRSELAVGIEVSELGSDNIKFESVITDSASFSTPNTFGFTSVSVIITNDDTVDIDFSFDGSTVHGTLKAGEIWNEKVAQTKVYFKSSGGSHNVRYWTA